MLFLFLEVFVPKRTYSTQPLSKCAELINSHVYGRSGLVGAAIAMAYFIITRIIIQIFGMQANFLFLNQKYKINTHAHETINIEAYSDKILRVPFTPKL